MMVFAGLGDPISDITGQLTNPNNSEAIQLILQSIELSNQSTAASVGGAPSPPFQLSDLTPYLRAYVFYKQNPMVVKVGAAVLFFGGLAILYRAGTKHGCKKTQ